MSLGPLYVFLGEVSVQVLCQFFNWVLCLPGEESCEFFIYFADQNIVWGIIGKYVFPYCWFSFHFNVVFFSHAEAFYFDEVPFVYSFLYVPCFRGCVCEDVAVWNGWDFPAMFSSRTFMVLWLIFKSFIHLEFIFVYGVSWWSNFIFLHVAVQISQHHLLKRLFLLHFMFLPPLSNINWPYRLEFISGEPKYSFRSSLNVAMKCSLISRFNGKCISSLYSVS